MGFALLSLLSFLCLVLSYPNTATLIQLISLVFKGFCITLPYKMIEKQFTREMFILGFVAFCALRSDE